MIDIVLERQNGHIIYIYTYTHIRTYKHVVIIIMIENMQALIFIVNVQRQKCSKAALNLLIN